MWQIQKRQTKIRETTRVESQKEGRDVGSVKMFNVLHKCYEKYLSVFHLTKFSKHGLVSGDCMCACVSQRHRKGDLSKEFIKTYPIFLNSSSIGTVDDVDEGKSLRQILCDYLVHNIRLANPRTVNDNHAVLKFKKKSKGVPKSIN